MFWCKIPVFVTTNKDNKEPQKEERVIMLLNLAVVSAIFRSVGEAWTKTIKPEISPLYDF